MNIPIISDLGAAANARSAAKVHQANARIARAQGSAAKAQAYGQASRIEKENEVAGWIAADNMERLREQGTRAQGSARAARGASGFSAEGSGSLAEVSVLEAFEQEAADMAQSRALQDTSARFNAAMTRRSGDIAMMGAEASAQYDEAQAAMEKQKARNANMSAYITAALMIAGGVAGGAGAFSSAAAAEGGAAASGAGASAAGAGAASTAGAGASAAGTAGASTFWSGGWSGALQGARLGADFSRMSMSGLPGTFANQTGPGTYENNYAMRYIGDELSKYFK